MHEAILGTIPPRMRARGQHPLELVGRGGADQAGGVADVGQQAVDVGQVDELLRPQRLGHRPGHGVGVDVVGLTLGVAADGGQDGDEVLGQEALEQARVDGVDVADEAQLGGPGGGQDEARRPRPTGPRPAARGR